MRSNLYLYSNLNIGLPPIHLPTQTTPQPTNPTKEGWHRGNLGRVLRGWLA